MSSLYPETVSLEGETLDYLTEHSKLLENLYEMQGSRGPLELSADLLFPLNDNVLQQEKWELFFDLFFPEKGAGRLFAVKGNTIRVNESRGGKEAVREMLDYLMVDEPDTMFNFAREQAKKQINAPAEFVSTMPRAKGKNNYAPPVNNSNDFFNNWPNNNNYYNNYKNNNNNNNNIPIGYTEEEEEAVGKMNPTIVRKYLPYKRRSKNRKTRRANRKLRKATRKNRK